MSSPAIDILTHALAIINERGWVQGAYSKTNKNPKLPGPVCISRAINDAALECDASEGDRWEARWAVIDLIGQPCIPAWNDGKANKQEVIKVLTKAMEIIEEVDELLKAEEARNAGTTRT